MEQIEQKEGQSFNWNEQIYNIVRDVLLRWHIICMFGVIVAIAADLFLTFRIIKLFEGLPKFLRV